jgi:hypothetical protein
VPIGNRYSWNDTGAADLLDGNYEEQYYYCIRTVNTLGEISYTSRTVGKWTKEFSQGVSTFSMPLEPLQTMLTSDYLTDMNARYVKWMDPVLHTWMKYGDGGLNDTQMEVGNGYEVAFDSISKYTFLGMPGAMIKYHTYGSIGFDYKTDAKSLSASVDTVSGDVILTWGEPLARGPTDHYNVYYSTTRDGFDEGTAILLTSIPSTRPMTYIHSGAAASAGQDYYMVIPVDDTNVEGASTYSIGVWTEEYLDQYDTMGIPLILDTNQTADWYCDQIDDVVGINYFLYSVQRWGWHSTRMGAGAFDPVLVMTEGYQISTSGATKFTFIGI